MISLVQPNKTATHCAPTLVCLAKGLAKRSGKHLIIRPTAAKSIDRNCAPRNTIGHYSKDGTTNAAHHSEV